MTEGLDERPGDPLAGEPRELIDGYLGGTLDADGVAGFTAWLKADPAHVRAYVREASFSEDVTREVRAREERRAQNYPSARHVTVKDAPGARHAAARRRRSPWWVMGGLAAAAALLIALNGLMARQYPPVEAPIVARIAVADGTAMIRRGAFVLPAVGGTTLCADDQVVLSGSGWAEIGFGDGTSLTLTPGTDLQLIGDQQQKRFYLASGEVAVHAAKQPAELPLLIATADAEVTVVGTIFGLAVVAGGTRLTVSEGAVRMLDRATRIQQRVTAGGTAQAGPALAAMPSRLAPAKSPAPLVGIEMSAVGEEGPELAFVDAFRQAAPWRASGIGGELALTAERWVRALAPGQIAETVMCRRLGGRYPGGTWTCLYDGAGEVEFAGDAQAQSRANGRITVAVKPADAGIVLRVIATDPADPVRNIRMLMPGTELSHMVKPFHEQYLARWRGVAVLGAGDWTERYPGEASLGWEGRLRRGGPLPPGAGRPVEDTLDLASALGSDVWLQAPYQADDRFHESLADLVHGRLGRDQRVYLELGNDMWDGAWAAGRYAVAQANSAGIKPVEWYADRSLTMFALWRQRFSDDPRLVRVLSTVMGNPYFTEPMLAWKDAAKQIDVLAISAAIGGGIGHGWPAERLLALSRDEALAFLSAGIADVRQRLPAEVALARTLGLRLVAKHAGIALWPGEVQGQLTWRHYVHCDKFRHDPAVGPLLGEWLAIWQDVVGDVICLKVAMDQPRDADASPATLAPPEQLPQYQAVAPILQRQARAKRTP